MCHVEVISKRTRRPILSITPDDLGSMPLQRAMMHWLLLAEKWKAILLIDHCDAIMRRNEFSGQRGDNSGKIIRQK